MRILHVIHKIQKRGAENFACQLGEHQSTRGHIVKIVSVYYGNATMTWQGSIENLDGREETELDWKAWRKLARVINDFNPDIVQANSGDTLKYTVLSKLIFRWRNPIIFRNASEVGLYLGSRYKKMINRFLYRGVSGVASVSLKSKEDLIFNFPFIKNRIKVIPIGLEEKLSIPKAKLNGLKKFNIIHVGGYTFEKNHKNLLEIFRIIVDERDDVKLHLIGDGPLKPQIEKLVNHLDLQDYISFYGVVNNPLDYIKSADLLVLPSKIEGLPGVLLEAMYCKTPVVAYNVGGISEIVKKETGSLIEKNNQKQFARSILQNLIHPNSAQIENAYDMVNENYMNSRIADEFLKFYVELKNFNK
jgi:L-malate glycosyltransferase